MFQEGILLGRYVVHVSNNVTDHNVYNLKSEPVTCRLNFHFLEITRLPDIQDYIPCSGLFSWYENSGAIDKAKLRDLLDQFGHMEATSPFFSPNLTNISADYWLV